MEGQLHQTKIPFDPTVAFKSIRKAIAPYPKAAMFQLADDGYDSVFHQLIACILSIRTRDEASLPLAKKLFSVASTPDAIAALDFEELDKLIQATSFHYGKALQIQAIAKATVEEYNGELPADESILLSFKGVGSKCANLALGVTGNDIKISVDIHVHRVTNRWGYVTEKTPEKTLWSLTKKLPKKHWIEINELLVPFGKHICTLKIPRCSTCPVLSMCRQVGVQAHR